MRGSPHMPINDGDSARILASARARGAIQAPVELLRCLAQDLPPPVGDEPWAEELRRIATYAAEAAGNARELLRRPFEGKLDDAAHDLRRPAAYVVSACDFLSEEQVLPPAATLAALREVRDAAARYLSVLDRFLAPAVSANEAVAGDVEVSLAREIAEVAAWPRCAGRVLMADDEADQRELLFRMLAPDGHDVISVADGDAAINELARSDFDLLLLDVMMPGMDGFGVLRHVRSGESGSRIPIMLLSAHGGDAAVARGIALGADDYFVRPVNPAMLRARVSAEIERSRLRSAEREKDLRIRALMDALIPAAVQPELAEHGAIAPRRRDHVGVLFLDIVGFTAYCERHRDRPEKIVARLQVAVNMLEDVCRCRGVLKIKTIGDAFLATAGLLDDSPDPAGRLVAAGIEMIAAVNEVGWQSRVGIAVGPVMAGQIGAVQFQYDVWGSTVNLAARLEGAARPNGMAIIRDAFPAGLPGAAPRSVDLFGIGEQIEIWDLPTQG
jgi:adenylate cyclase